MLKYKIAILILCFANLGCAQTNIQKADSLLNKILPDQVHGLAVLIAQDNKILYQKAVGYADVNNKKPVNLETIFRIGSVTKQFTATAILKLVGEGKVKLSDPLVKFIPGFPGGDKVTVHHLLTHTSGIKSYTDQHDFINKVTKPTTTDALVNEIKALGYDFSPGEKWKYSNSGYFLLGYIIERQSGLKYNEFMRQNIFEPIEMLRTGIYNNEKNYKNEALGYSYENEPVTKATDWNMTWAGAAGNIYSTTTDLYKWNQAIFSEKVIPHQLLKKAVTKVVLNDSSEYPYSYGWMPGEYKGLRQYAHGGGLHGFLSFLVYYPEIKGTVVVLSNCSPPKNVVPGKLATALTDIFFEDQLTKNIKVEPDYSFYNLYVGQYEYPGGKVMTITRNGAHLYAQLSGQSKYEIFPKGVHQFFWKIVSAEITFQINEKGKVYNAIHKQNGGQINALKREEQLEISLEEGTF